MQKICLVCDIPNWAFDIIAKNVKKNLDNKFDIRIDYYDMREEPDNFYEFLERNKDCDLIHFFWRKSLLQMDTDIFKEKVKASGRDYNAYISEMKRRLSTGVHDFMFLEPENILLFSKIYNEFTSHYYVNSKKLFKEYLNYEELKKPDFIVHDICDVTSFVPMNMERFNKGNKDEMVIGWVGNSKGQLSGIDLKGFNTIIKPVVEELKEEGYNVAGNYADRNVRWRTTEEMPEYYSEIDVCICASIHESTPLPVIEAMACGVPIISTDVGVVREAFGEKQQKFIIGDRELGKNDEAIKNKLKETIVTLYNNRNILKELSDENMRSIVEYDGGKIIKEYESYFDLCLNDIN